MTETILALGTVQIPHEYTKAEITDAFETDDGEYDVEDAPHGIHISFNNTGFDSNQFITVYETGTVLLRGKSASDLEWKTETLKSTLTNAGLLSEDQHDAIELEVERTITTEDVEAAIDPTDDTEQ